MTDAGSSAAAIQRARVLLELGRCEEAATALRDVLARESAHPEALVLLSRALRESRPLESYNAAVAAIHAEPNAAWVLVNAAWAADAVGRKQEAIDRARAAVAIDPHSAAGFQALAQLLARGNTSMAETRGAANKAIELAPHDPTSWIAAGNVALAEKNLHYARGYYEHALALKPDDRVAQLNLAAVRQAEGSLGHSIDLLQSIIRLNPRDEEARSRIDDLAGRLLREMLWLSLGVGFVLAIIVSLAVGTR